MNKQTVYVPIKVEDEDRVKIPSSVPEDEWGVHRTHCCKKHGCKYGYEYCPVVLGHVKQDHKCESGDFDNGCFEPEIAELQKQEGYFFTEEQLNQLLSDVIKDALDTAADKAVTINTYKTRWSGLNKESYVEPDVYKESITNTFDITYQKHKV